MSKLVSGHALAGLFELFADGIECVVLNGCYSVVQAEAIAQHINYVIGISQAIGDKAAIAFTVGFYKALVANRSIEDAYNFGCLEIQLQGIPEQLKPVIYKKNIPVQQVISKPADKRTDLTPGQRQRISQELESLQKQYDLFSDILKRLRRDLAIMLSTGVLFLEQQIEQAEAEIEQLAQKIENLENKLQ